MNKHIKIIVLGLIILASCDSKKIESTNQPAASAAQEIKLTAEQKQNAGINLGDCQCPSNMRQLDGGSTTDRSHWQLHHTAHLSSLW